MKYWMICIVVTLLLIGIAGCSRNGEFRVAFGNRLPYEHDGDPIMDGKVIGFVGAGETAEFKVTTRILDNGPTNSDYPDAAYVTFAMRDRKTGQLSREFPRTIYEDRTEYIEINEWDF